MFPAGERSPHRPSSHAVDRSRNRGSRGVLGVRFDGFDRQVEFIGAVDLSRHAVVLAWCEVVGVGEVV